MRETLNGIVINVIKYNDKHNIARIYTAEHGMLTFMVRLGTTASARRRMAMFLPLSIISFESITRSGNSIGNLGEVQRSRVLTSIYGDPMKSAIVMFMSELLSHSIHEEEQNPVLYSFIKNSVITLDHSSHSVANFHICFLYRLGIILGIEPNTETYAPGYWFNMREGVFAPSPLPGDNALPPQEAEVLFMLRRMTYENLHLFKFNRTQRNRMLEMMLSYYGMHNSTLGTLRSPDVLKQLFV